MAQSKEFVDASHALNDLSHALALLESENASLRGAVDGLCNDNAKLRELCAGLLTGYECGYGELCKGCTWDGLGDSKTFSCLPRAKARELGVEVAE